MPRSLKISREIPTREKICKRASATDIISIFFSGRKCFWETIENSIKVKTYLWPSDITGNNIPIISFEALEKGFVNTGIFIIVGQI